MRRTLDAGEKPDITAFNFLLRKYARPFRDSQSLQESERQTLFGFDLVDAVHVLSNIHTIKSQSPNSTTTDPT